MLRTFGRVTLAATVTAVVSLTGLALPAVAHPVSPSIPGGVVRAGVLGQVNAKALAAPVAFAKPTAGRPSATSFDVRLTRNPASSSQTGFTTPSDPCTPDLCREVDVRVPAGSDQTLYVRGAWTALTQYAHVWGVSPSGAVYGQSQTQSLIDKRTGNSDVAPLAEFTVADPQPGVWKIQYRAVFGVDIPIRATVALSKGAPLEFPTLNVKQLADAHLTQHLTYNIVFVNRKWTHAEVAAFRAAMPTEYRQSVLEKQTADGCGNTETGLESTAVNWGTEHYCGTAGAGSTGSQPYFEPTHYTISYRFLQADSTWTRGLFAAMKAATRQDQPFRINPSTGSRRYQQGDYLSDYTSREGARDRGAGALVANPTVGDTIDAFTVEDWVFNHRGDKAYARSFTDVESGAKHSARFINPDPGAYYDPFYTRTGRKDLDRMPQGPDTTFTFFALDTFGSNADGDSTARYFRPTAYHFFDVSNHMIDPDQHEAGAGPNDARVWGGRYRFFLHDLGAGPNILETSDGFTANTPRGSADLPNGDPPIWDYTNDPAWAGKLVANTARDAQAELFSRLIGNYLYRPVPADVFFLASNNWVDCYSNPQCSPDGISYTDLTKVFNPSYVEKNLGAAVPGVTFTTERTNPHLKTFRYLGCAKDRAVANPDPVTTPTGSNTPYVLVPDPNCVGKKSDVFQEGLEYAKSRGDTIQGGVNDLTVNTDAFRAFVEKHRADIAPQPAGQFTLTNVSVVFPGAQTWALPAIVGGIALNTPNNEGWGILNNLNDRFKGTYATNCAKSQPFAPGCNGVPALSGSNGFSYTIEHESSHFLGLLHPHDYQTVEKDATGKWNYYGTASSHYEDFSMAPTTYFGDFAPYSVLDQDIIDRGHAAEYVRQVQDYLADAYLIDGIHGLNRPSNLTRQKVTEAQRWQTLGSSLFSCGDYLHAERALRNAALSAQGTFGPIVAPRSVKPGEKVLFQVNPQPVFGPDGQPMAGCVAGNSALPPHLTQQPNAANPPQTATSRHGLAATGLDTTLPLVAVLALSVAGLRRSRRSGLPRRPSPSRSRRLLGRIRPSRLGNPPNPSSALPA